MIDSKLGSSRLTAKTASTPSTTVTSEMLNVGASPSLSVIVPVPLAVVFAVVPEVTSPFKVKFSVTS